MVTETRQVKGQDTAFALGDITDVAESKRATAANRHVEVVAGDIKALVEGKRELAAYQPRPAAIILPPRPDRGSGPVAGQGKRRPRRHLPVQGRGPVDGPTRPVALRVYGTAELVERQGYFGTAA